MISVSFIQLKYSNTRKILFPKLVKKSKLDTSGHIIAFIGENASGKTNALKICQVQVNENSEILESA